MNQRSIVIEYKRKKHVFAYIRRNPSTKYNEFFVSTEQLDLLELWKREASTFTYWIEPSKRPKLVTGKLADYYPVHKEDTEEVDYYIGMLGAIDE